MLNLILAVAWLLGGLGILIYETLYGPLRLRLLGQVSIGWLMLVLSAWNWVRFFMMRALDAEQESARRVREAEERRQRRERDERQANRPFEYHAEFDFTRQPEPPPTSPPNSPPRGGPPSNA
jgi:hypothetical protein